MEGGVHGRASSGEQAEAHPDRGRGARQRRVAQQAPRGPGRGQEALHTQSHDGHTIDLVGKTLELWN